MTINRAIVIVLDSLGIGELPDAADYGDAGSNTLVHIAEAVGGLHLPNLAAMGLGNIEYVDGVGPVQSPRACYGKMAELSHGKDTTTGHWEIMGVVTDHPFPVYPIGFPPEVVGEFESRIGRRVLGNKVASGTEIIEELGAEHLRTGRPIVYTSADSVFQIACHEEIIPVDELYEMCRAARRILVPPDNVQRVIARPFVGEPDAFVRTRRRRDFSVVPPRETLLDLIVKTSGQVIAIGKIEDIFAHRGISAALHTTTNADGIQATIASITEGQGTLIFTNLVDCDMLYGHRNDPHGYARALEEFDSALPEITSAMKEADMLVITADHGCDPTTPSTDHSREYVPLLVYGRRLNSGVDLGVRSTFCDVAATLADLLHVPGVVCGSTFGPQILP